jgi:hypothetical protein
MAIEIGTVNADTDVKIGATVVNTGYIGYDNFYGTPSFFLDFFPTAHHAYSLRKLRTAYTGKCLRIRRTTTTPTVTTTTVDLSFDSNNTISLNSAITYVSGTATTAINLGQFCASVVNGYSNPDLVNTNQNIFVVTWFDQSGNNKNPTQATAGSQPRLVSLGNLELSGGKVAVRFVRASSNILNLADTTANINNMSSYWVGQYASIPNTNSFSSIGYSLSASATTTARFYFPSMQTTSSSGMFAAYGSNQVSVLLDTTQNTNRKLYEFLAPTTGSTTLVQGWANGVAKGTNAIVTAATANILLGGAGANTTLDGYIQEVIGYQSNLNRLEKEKYINAYWKIF